MKKEMVIVFCVTSMLLFCGNVGHAQDMEGKFGVGARAAYVDYSNDHYVAGGARVKAEPDDVGMYGVNLTYFVQKYASFELSADYTEADIELRSLGSSGTAGALEQVPVLLTARIHFSTNPKVNPYIGAGVGYYWNSFDTDREAEFIYGPGADIEIDDTYGFHVNAGIEVFVIDDLAINVDIKHIWSDVELEVPGFSDEDINLNALVAGVGLKYYF
jgi:outer membrane protein